VWSLTQLLDAEATTTAQVGRRHVSKLPERTGYVNRQYALVARQAAIHIESQRLVDCCREDTPFYTPTFWRSEVEPSATALTRSYFGKRFELFGVRGLLLRAPSRRLARIRDVDPTN
jgi:hypothetical protein